MTDNITFVLSHGLWLLDGASTPLVSKTRGSRASVMGRVTI